MGICKNVDFSVWCEVGEWGGQILVAFHMVEFDFDGEGRDKLLDGLDDVIIGAKVAEG